MLDKSPSLPKGSIILGVHNIGCNVATASNGQLNSTAYWLQHPTKCTHNLYVLRQCSTKWTTILLMKNFVGKKNCIPFSTKWNILSILWLNYEAIFETSWFPNCTFFGRGNFKTLYYILRDDHKQNASIAIPFLSK